jgi:alkylation response protein AidB-like acyl-CoA dehydrogenase
VRDGDYYILNGRKTFITAAPISDFGIIFAKTDIKKGTKGISTFIVDLKLPGISFGSHEKKMGIIGCPTSDIVLEDVRVHKSDLLGEEGKGFINAMKTLDYGRLGVAAQSGGHRAGLSGRSNQIRKGTQAVRQAHCRFPGHQLHDRRHGNRGRSRQRAFVQRRSPEGQGRQERLNEMLYG